jgi:hypothetical protein
LLATNGVSDPYGIDVNPGVFMSELAREASSGSAETSLLVARRKPAGTARGTLVVSPYTFGAGDGD